jgi:hypothetical protein
MMIPLAKRNNIIAVIKEGGTSGSEGTTQATATGNDPGRSRSEALPIGAHLGTYCLVERWYFTQTRGERDHHTRKLMNRKAIGMD